MVMVPREAAVRRVVKDGVFMNPSRPGLSRIGEIGASRSSISLCCLFTNRPNGSIQFFISGLALGVVDVVSASSSSSILAS